MYLTQRLYEKFGEKQLLAGLAQCRLILLLHKFNYNIFWTNWFRYYLFRTVNPALHPWPTEANINRKSPRELLLWKGDLKLCIKFTGEHPQSKCHFIKVSFCQNHFYRNIFGRFLLYKDISWKNPNLFTGIFFMNFFKTCFSFLKYPT